MTTELFVLLGFIGVLIASFIGIERTSRQMPQKLEPPKLEPKEITFVPPETPKNLNQLEFELRETKAKIANPKEWLDGN